MSIVFRNFDSDDEISQSDHLKKAIEQYRSNFEHVHCSAVISCVNSYYNILFAKSNVTPLITLLIKHTSETEQARYQLGARMDPDITNR